MTVDQWAVNSCWCCKVGIGHETDAAKERGRMDKTPYRMQSRRMCENGCGTMLGIHNTTGYCAACKYEYKLRKAVLGEAELDMFLTAANSLSPGVG